MMQLFLFMKWSLFVILSFFYFSGKAQTDSCEIKVTIEGFTGGKIKLISVFGDQNFIADSTLMDAKGNFEFKKRSPFKSGYYYIILPDYTSIHMILDDDQHFQMLSNKADLIGMMKINSSIDNHLLYESFRFQLRQEKKIDSLNTLKKSNPTDTAIVSMVDRQLKQIQRENKSKLEIWQKEYPKSFFTKFKTAGQNPEIVDVRNEKGEIDLAKQLQLFRLAFWDQVDLSDIRLLYTPVIVNKLKRFIKELTPQQPDSIIRQADFIIKKSLVNKEMFQFISNWIALKYQPTQTNVMDGEAVFVHILDTYFTKENAYWMDDKELTAIQKKVFEMKASLLNCQGPDVISTDLDGKTRSIYELKEDFVVVFMYDPDCDHCQKETPLLKEFYGKWKAKGVEVFAIILNSTDQQWRDFVKKYQTESWINVHDPTNRSIYAKYFVDITPEMYVLNKNRKIIGKNLKAEQLPFIIEQELKKNSTESR